MEKDKSTEQKILDAAREVFVRKGLHGSRMQEIADQAGINKAMLHYYFRSKDQLFAAIFDEALSRLIPRAKEIITSDEDLYSKIEQFVDHYITTIMLNPLMPLFVLNELNQHPQQFVQEMFKKMKPDLTPFFKQVNEEIQAGRIRPVHPMHLMVNILAMCIFPFVAKPMIQELSGIEGDMYSEFLEARKKQVPQFIINAIKL